MKVRWFSLFLLTALFACQSKPPLLPDGDMKLPVWEDARWDIWANHFGCSDEEIAFLEKADLYDFDTFVLLFIARWSQDTVQDVVKNFRTGGHKYLHYTILYYRMPWDEMYLDVPNGTEAAPPFDKALEVWWKRNYEPRFRLHTKEIRAIMNLRIAHLYFAYGFKDFFALYRETDRVYVKPFEHISRKKLLMPAKNPLNWCGKPVLEKRIRPPLAPTSDK